MLAKLLLTSSSCGHKIKWLILNVLCKNNFGFRPQNISCQATCRLIQFHSIEKQYFFRDDKARVVWHSKIYRTARTPRGIGLFKKQEKEGDRDEKEKYWEDSPWPEHSSSIFSQLNTFIERCNDALELVEVTQQFETLKSASVTGSSGAYDYHAQLNEIQESFEEALFVFKENIQVIIYFTASPIS